MRNFQFTAGLIETGKAGGRHQGTVFQDSDAYKWIEAVAYSLTLYPNPSLEAAAEEAIDWIGRAQTSDGYLNTYYTLNAPDQRFRNLTEGHELYCAGHLFEAAAAFHEATGKRKLLDIACRLADCLVRHFLPGDGMNHGYPGHPEVELALVRLYHATKNREYLRLCEYFLNVRGQGESWRDIELADGSFHKHWGDMLFSSFSLDYFQAHAPVRAQREAVGHAVRAMYLYSAMADVARLTGEDSLREACQALYESVVRRQMYVTGGIGAAADGECFSTDYDLPNDSVYSETCASVGLMMFSARMWQLNQSPLCYDVWEKALYNTVLASMGRDGRHFFYVNPLSVDPRVARANTSLKHIKTSRPTWFGCACCPPNMARSILSMGSFIYARGENTLFVLSHIASTMTSNETRAELTRSGDAYTLSVDMPAIALKLRVPQGYQIEADQGSIEGGYLCIAHPGGRAAYAYRLVARIRVLRAHPRVAHDVGKVCVTYGQIVYCLEEADNGSALCELALVRGSGFKTVARDWLPEGMCALEAEGIRYIEDGWSGLYEERTPKTRPVTLVFVPYSQWNNRGEGEMCVWVNEAHGGACRQSIFSARECVDG